MIANFNVLIKNLKKDVAGLNTVQVALLADFASQHLVKAVKASAIDHGINLQIWEAEYDSVELNIYDRNSPLYKQPFEFILLFGSPLKLYKQYSHSHSKENFAAQKLEALSNAISVLHSNTNAKIILSNFMVTDDGVFGNYANKVETSYLYQVRKLNFELMNLAMGFKNLFLVDVEQLGSVKGKTNVFNPRLYVHADIIYELDFLAEVAGQVTTIIITLRGHFKKCVILDLDNTLWGGIIGDDGIDNIQVGDLGLGKAFTHLQVWMRNLKERGMILAVCSKNTEAIAKEVFERHPGMTLRLEDISVFAANWETKVDNIIFIQNVLNIGFDSMVFIDDNPFERAIVKQHIPNITVPDLPEDPAEYVAYLQSLNLFETASYSNEDKVRTKQYQEEASRAIVQKTFESEDAFLESLQMVAAIKPVDDFTCPRVAQLTQRSNQFNLRTKRYTEEDIRRVMANATQTALAISLKDKFGDYGLISAVILEEKENNSLFIDTWIMSCRVLKRGVEVLVLNAIAEKARQLNRRFIVGEYLPTAKNGIVKDHYKQLGFQQREEDLSWVLDLTIYEPQTNFIQKKELYAID